MYRQLAITGLVLIAFEGFVYGEGETPATPYNYCSVHLQSAAGPQLAAFNDCFVAALGDLLQLYQDAAQQVQSTRSSFEAMPRTAGEFYVLEASDCTQEMAVRGTLEGLIRNLGESVESIGLVAAAVIQLRVEAYQLLSKAVSGGYATDIVDHVNAMNDTTGAFAGVDSLLQTAHILQSDMQRTTVVNRCGHADLPEPPSSQPAEPAGGGGGGVSASSITDLPNGDRQWDNPTINGVALSGCTAEGTELTYCHDHDAYERAADQFCRDQGFARHRRVGYSSQGEVQTRNVRTGVEYAPGGPVLTMVVCRH